MILATGQFRCDTGPDEMVAAFYSTVGCRLEPNGRGTRFPAIMSDLYEGVLLPGRAQAAYFELKEIEQELRWLPADKVLGIAQPTQSRSALECFQSPDGKPLTEHLQRAIEECLRGGNVLTTTGGRTLATYAGSGVIAAFGAVWVLIGYRFFPHWILVPASQNKSDTGGLRIWTVGFLFIAMAAGFAIAERFPRMRVWFKRRAWAQATIAIATVLVWIIFGSSDL